MAVVTPCRHQSQQADDQEVPCNVLIALLADKVGVNDQHAL